jgi:hypothetical protein
MEEVNIFSISDKLRALGLLTEQEVRALGLVFSTSHDYLRENRIDPTDPLRHETALLRTKFFFAPGTPTPEAWK